MIRLFKIKDQKKEDAANANGRAPGKKQSAGELRLHKGLAILNSVLLVSSLFLISVLVLSCDFSHVALACWMVDLSACRNAVCL